MGGEGMIARKFVGHNNNAGNHSKRVEDGTTEGRRDRSSAGAGMIRESVSRPCHCRFEKFSFLRVAMAEVF